MPGTDGIRARAVATPRFANVADGPDGLELVRAGHDAAETVERLVAADEGAASRRVGVVGRDGSVAAFTGDDCVDHAGDRRGEQAAATYVARPGGGYDGRNDRWIEVGVDDHGVPIESFPGTNDFENRDLAVVRDAIARGWDAAEGEGRARLVDALWRGLQRLDRE